jgi:nitrogen fixation/metabolism regulation signal transduction histidine kinase|nr:MAG TPA: hypothetical protein [Caudoviricetes sp.]
MLLLIFTVIIIASILYYRHAKYKNNSSSDLDVLCVVLILVNFIPLAVLGLLLSNLYENQGVDQKIKMYETQNQQLERKIDVAVKSYMNHEKDTYKEFKAGDGMALITTYPELRSNELVKEQMNTYQSNNRKIAKLKEKEIDCNVTKWWVYFGGE